MAEIINLNRARKARTKAEDKARAAANRAAHGRTKAQKQSADRDRERAARQLDGQKLDD
ncbi:DUF4169 family protein [Brevundimonas mediterranea]|uniref:DUF4169 family protein n=1 Tax=Brevundimonas mediterranea TaxID=74329 RepID=A0A7W6EYP0_9CAUL|nr:DUF4169 family protein [Brevundimonas mediterranea]MBB3871166.1 hypothetical protein [Brevundimonas mediterranea]